MKLQTTEKTQGTQEKRNSSPHPEKSNSSHPGPALKAATLEMMKKKDGEEVMDNDSVVFTEPSSSDHLPKGTLSRLP